MEHFYQPAIPETWQECFYTSLFSISPGSIKFIAIFFQPLDLLFGQPSHDLERVAEAPRGDLRASLVHDAVHLDVGGDGRLHVVVVLGMIQCCREISHLECQ